jgi:hypothetical protein
LPFACSNVDACPVCQGTGSVRIRQSRRKQGKARRRVRQHQRKLANVRWTHGQPPYMATMATWRFRITHYMELANGVRSCTRCNGLGSAEANDDEIWRETLEAEAEALGYSIENGEGDPCDIFAVEYRDTPDKEDESATAN